MAPTTIPRQIVWDTPEVKITAVARDVSDWELALPGYDDKLNVFADEFTIKVIMQTLGEALAKIAEVESDVKGCDSAYEVQSLGVTETDQVWEDKDGDHYQWGGEGWLYRDGNFPDDDWEEVDESWLTKFAPYTAIGPREPRKVRELTETERGSEWEYINFGGVRYTYKWSDVDQHWLGRERDREWELLSPEYVNGPNIGLGQYLTEIL